MKKMTLTNRKIGYQWVMVILCVLMYGSAFGFASRNNGGFYMAAITETLGINRTAFSVTDTIRYVTTTIMSLFFGTFIHRYGTKKMICSGLVCVILATAMNAVAESLWVFYLGSIFLGLGFAFTGTAMAGSVVGRWCKGNRGVVMGIISASNGMTGALATQILVPIIHQEGADYGFRQSYWVVVGILVVSLIAILAFFKEKPLNDSEQTVKGKKKRRGQDWVGLEFDEVKRQHWFYLAMVALFLTGIMLHGMNSVVTIYLLDVGLDVDFIKNFSSVASLMVVGTKILAGISYDRYGMRITLGICNIAATVCMFMLALVTNSDVGMVLVIGYYFIHTIASPHTSILRSIIASDLVGNKSYDKVCGIFISASTAGFALSAPMMNAIYDLCGSYRPALFGCGILMVIATILFHYVFTAAHKKRLEVEAR